MAELLPGDLLLWGKTARESKQETDFHPLICHLLDAGSVCRCLWRRAMRREIRELMAKSLSLDEPACESWLPLLTALHDLGKASPSFQRKWSPGWRRLEEAGFRSSLLTPPHSHDLMTAALLPSLLLGTAGIPPPRRATALRLGRILGGHHGTFPLPGQAPTSIGGAERWEAVRGRLAQFLAGSFGVSPHRAPEIGPESCGQAEVLLGGLTCICDWIASSERLFPPVGDRMSAAEYTSLARKRANAAVEDIGWESVAPEAEPLTFCDLFHSEPWPIQSAVLRHLAGGSAGPSLTVIEAPTGTGKTECAFLLSQAANRLLGQQGAYVGLPTQATSNQMFGRVAEFLERAYPGQRVNLHLAHGDAARDGRYMELQVAANGQDEGVVAEGWFCQSKRVLLAGFGVGTVDQALLSVLQVRHWFLRLFGLTGKTLIVDEVHAYDAYTSRLLDRLLEWCARLGVSVVLLSATLPAARRRELLATYGGAEDRELAAADYPRISRADGTNAAAWALPPPKPKRVEVKWVSGSGVLGGIRRALAGGGCAAYICNTVGDAQRVYLDAVGLLQDCEVTLFHSRFTRARRATIERQVTQQFGKDGCRPHRALLVATQVVEQSLDLDFDLMVTQHAPVDLVIQRAGRLHRHDLSRPPNLEEPGLWLVQLAEDENGIPVFGPSRFVYDRYLLLRSYLALRDCGSFDNHQDVEELIESVYGDERRPKLDETWANALREARREFEANRCEAEKLAEGKLVARPQPGVRVMDQPSWGLEEGNPEVERRFRGLTRLGRPSVRAVCLHQGEDGLRLHPSGGEAVDLDARPARHVAGSMLDNVLRISHPAIFSSLVQAGVPPAWQGSPWLRHHYPLIFQDGCCVIGGYRLTLDDELGLCIHRLDEEGE